MGITTFGFLCFLAVTLIVYYLVPQKTKWKILLAASLLFICTFHIKGLLFILFTALSIWFSGKKMEQLDKATEQSPAAIRKKKKHLLQLTLLANIGILAALKYLFPFLQNHSLLPPFSLLLPLGISYYTLQAISYIMDVYWKRIPAEHSYGKVLLYTCYFPQMIQGPISKYKDLSFELTEKEHRFSSENLKHGVQLMLWGYFKSMAVGERFMTQVNNLFHGSETAYGLSVFAGLSFFGIALYCNFSGGIDIVRGASECFGVTLPENFQQPYFSKSLSEFWRRWHMSLGGWMKDYAFYPLSMSRLFSRLKKRLKKQVSRKMANKIAIAIANVLVFLLVGVWHGFGSNFAVWGLYNGLILAFSELMEGPYSKIKEKLHIRESSLLWSAFCVLRTFFVVAIGRTTDCADTAGGALRLVGNLFRLHRTNLGLISMDWFTAVAAVLCVAILIAVSVIHEKGISIRQWLDRKPFVVQVIFWLLLIQLLACLGQNRTGGGFIYANY